MNKPAREPSGKSQPKSSTAPKQRTEAEEVAAFLAECVDNPKLFVYGAFEWGKGQLKPSRSDPEPGPDKWQLAILDLIAAKHFTMTEALQIAVASGHGVGKAQPKSLVINTPLGVRRWGDLRQGDFVFGSDGRPTRIIAIHERGLREIYRVSFDDRTSTLACGEHLWRARGRHQRRMGKPWVTMDTAAIMAAGVKRGNGPSRARQWEIPMCGAVEFPWRWTPVEPYAMGVWLGDGSVNTSCITSADPEIPARISALGTAVAPGRKTRSAADSYTIRNMKPPLRSAGVGHLGSHERFVPDCYKFNTSEVRKRVLMGLIDTDGFVTPDGGVIFTSVSPRLAADVAWLARSLGGKALQHKPQRRFACANGVKKQGRDGYNVSITLPDGMWDLAVPRKQARIRATTQKRYLARWIDDIQPVGVEDCMCITVEAADSLYLANDFIVTHNSSLIAWIILWFINCKPHCNGIVTANTGKQLSGKTWREVGVWVGRMHEWYRRPWVLTATKLYHRDHERTWFISAIEWSERNPEAFAGLHAEWVLILFDEGSRIPKVIWETVMGALTTPHAMWLSFGNPTRNEGSFFECFHKMRHRWFTFQVDSRVAKMTNKAQIKQWVEDYGEDSDFVRVRVRGIFPRAGTTQLIGHDLVEAAFGRYRKIGPLDLTKKHEGIFGPLVLGADIARFGDDSSSIWVRRGRYARRLARYTGKDTMQMAGYIAEFIDKMQPDMVFVDGTGLGAGVVDRLRQLGYGSSVFEVLGAAKAQNEKEHKNLRAECWTKMRAWFVAEAAVEPDQQTLDDVTGPEYFFDAGQRLQLESKDDMKARGMASPDNGDAIAMTFASVVAPRRDEDIERDRYDREDSQGSSSWAA